MSAPNGPYQQGQYPPPYPQHQAPRRKRHVARWLLIVPGAIVALVIVAGFAGARGKTPAQPDATAARAAAAAEAQPDTAAAARSVASQYLSLYSAGQWGAAWAFLAPSAQRLAPEGLWAAFHRDCPPQAAGMAYEVEGVTLAGRTAVITYTIPVVERLYGSAANPMLWTAAGWRVEFDGSAVAQYSHGGLEADVAAAKAAGDC